MKVKVTFTFSASPKENAQNARFFADRNQAIPDFNRLYIPNSLKPNTRKPLIVTFEQ